MFRADIYRCVNSENLSADNCHIFAVQDFHTIKERLNNCIDSLAHTFFLKHLFSVAQVYGLSTTDVNCWQLAAEHYQYRWTYFKVDTSFTTPVSKIQLVTSRVQLIIVDVCYRP